MPYMVQKTNIGGMQIQGDSHGGREKLRGFLYPPACLVPKTKNPYLPFS